MSLGLSEMLSLQTNKTESPVRRQLGRLISCDKAPSPKRNSVLSLDSYRSCAPVVGRNICVSLYIPA